jgi:enoyl-CoA hydratase/carnithine racemase
LFQHSTEESLETQMELEAQAIARSSATDDFRRAVRDFVVKQRPRFDGR